VAAISPTPESDAARRRRGARLRHAGLALLAIAGALALAAAPSILGNYWLRILCTIYMYAVLAQGINIMAGYTGYPAFGNVVFFGVGAYATAITMVKLSAPFALGLAAAVCVCPLLALLLGPPLLRLKGHYFAIATLGLNEAVKEVASNTTGLTGGGMGLSLPLAPGGAAANAAMFYYLFLGAMLVSTWVTWEFARRNLGLACRAIRDNEAKAEAAGVYTTRSKTIAWMLSATMTGAVGGINAYWMAYIDPPGVFDMAIAVKAFVIFLLGGTGTVLGPVAGAVFVESIATLTWSKLLNWHLGAMGVIIMVVILFFPNGLRATLLAVRCKLRP
jgi:branched-chain amino acid transport system permease protein